MIPSTCKCTLNKAILVELKQKKLLKQIVSILALYKGDKRHLLQYKIQSQHLFFIL